MKLTKAQKKFSINFQEAEQELLVLTSANVGGAALFEKGIWEPHASLLAWIDLADDSLHLAEGGAGSWLAWLAEDADRSGWVHNLQPLHIYRVRCCKSCGSGAWLLLKVLERDLQEPRLAEVLTAYQQPVAFEDELCGSFQLERQFNWFTSDVDWIGKECIVFLDCDEDSGKIGGETAEQALAAFKQIYGNLAAWDVAFRKYAAAELTELANDWAQDIADTENEETDGYAEAARITEADFMRRITISEFSISSDGDYSAYYDDDDMFLGHVIMVDGNVAAGLAGIESAYIAG